MSWDGVIREPLHSYECTLTRVVHGACNEEHARQMFHQVLPLMHRPQIDVRELPEEIQP
jgi:hypothetical protein